MEPTTCCELVPLIIELDPSTAILMLTAVYENQCNSLHEPRVHLEDVIGFMRSHHEAISQPRSNECGIWKDSH
jgi:hypothetical protein